MNSAAGAYRKNMRYHKTCKESCESYRQQAFPSKHANTPALKICDTSRKQPPFHKYWEWRTKQPHQATQSEGVFHWYSVALREILLPDKVTAEQVPCFTQSKVHLYRNELPYRHNGLLLHFVDLHSFTAHVILATAKSV